MDPYRREAWRVEARARRAESRGGVSDRRSGVFEHSRHSVWLLWHLNSVWRLQHLSTPSKDKCKWQNDRERQHFIYKTSCVEKNTQIKLCRVVEPSKKVPDVNCDVQDLLLEVVDLKQEVSDLRSGGTPQFTLLYWLSQMNANCRQKWKISVIN